MDFPTMESLQAGLADIRRSPRDAGTLELIVRRPAPGAREILETGELSLECGLVGDTWNTRGSRRSADGGPHPDMQLNVMNARAVALVAGTPERRALAGDQLYVDLDLTEANLPAGTRLAIGTVVIEVTDQPHTGCAQFRQRFGPDASRLVNSDVGKALRLRGINAKVVVAGTITRGDAVTKVRTGA
jgi:MOSC domain-containing protein YiiM